MTLVASLTELCCRVIGVQMAMSPVRRLNSDILAHWARIVEMVPQVHLRELIWRELTPAQRQNWDIFCIFLTYLLSSTCVRKPFTFYYENTGNFMFKLLETGHISHWNKIYKILHLCNGKLEELESFQFEQVPNVSKIFGLSCVFPTNDIMNQKLNTWVQRFQMKRAYWESITILFIPHLSNAKLIYQLLSIMPNLKIFGFALQNTIVHDIPVLRKRLKPLEEETENPYPFQAVWDWFSSGSNELSELKLAFLDENIVDIPFVCFKPNKYYHPENNFPSYIYKVVKPLHRSQLAYNEAKAEHTPRRKLKKPKIRKGTIFGLNMSSRS